MAEAKIADLLNVTGALMALLIALRVLLYRRGPARYRPWIGTCAWVLINSGFVYAGWLVLDGYEQALVAAINTSALLYLTVRLHYTKGNLAPLLLALQQFLRRVHP